MDDHYADNVARMGKKYKGPASAEDEYENDEGEISESYKLKTPRLIVGGGLS